MYNVELYGISWLSDTNSLRFDIDSAVALDVSEDRAVEVDKKSLLSSFVGKNWDIDTYSVGWLQIWEPVGDIQGKRKQLVYIYTTETNHTDHNFFAITIRMQHSSTLSTVKALNQWTSDPTDLKSSIASKQPCELKYQWSLPHKPKL